MCDIAQGFDKYGVWRVDAHAAPNLRAALNLKVFEPCCHVVQPYEMHCLQNSPWRMSKLNCLAKSHSALCPVIKQLGDVQEGVVSSGNSLDYSKEDWDQLNAIGAAVKEMEAAGISWVAHLHNVPFLALKSITDIVDGDRPAQEEFLENLHAAAKALQVCSLTLCCVNATPV